MLRDVRLDQLGEMRPGALARALLIRAHQPRITRRIGTRSPTVSPDCAGAILADPDNFLELAAYLERASHPITSNKRLSRPPRGFEAARGTPVAGYVRWKNFTVHQPLSDAEMQSPAVVGHIVGFARRVVPLLEWGWAAIDDPAPAPVTIRSEKVLAAGHEISDVNWRAKASGAQRRSTAARMAAGS